MDCIWEGPLEGQTYRVTQTSPEHAIASQKVNGEWRTVSDATASFVFMRALLEVLPNKHLENYLEFVRELASKKRSQRFPCGLPQNAEIVLRELLLRAERYVGIFIESWSVRGDLHYAVKDLLDRGGRVEVLVQDASLIPKWDAGIVFRKAVGTYATPEAKRFAVMDTSGYRFEVDSDKREAVANFNEPETVAKLRSAFDKAFAMATPVGPNY